MKVLAKAIVRGIFYVLALPLVVVFYAVSPLFRQDTVFKALSEAISLVPGKTGGYLRAAFYSLVCPNTAGDVAIGFLTILSHRDTEVGHGVYIGPQCNIGMSRIGDNCLLGSGVHILSGKDQHHFSDPALPIKQQGGTFTKINIGAGSWIGNNSVVMADLGERCIVAAGAVVTKPVGPGCIVGGNPARELRTNGASNDHGR